MSQLFFVSMVLIINGILYSKDLNKAEYVPNEIILKLASETKIISPHSFTTGVAEIDAALLKFTITDISPVVPYKKDLNPHLPDINRIYRIKYTDSIMPDILSDDLSELKHVIYAEPRYIHYETITPNDPYYSNQWHLPVIDANLAWNTSQGDTNVIIAIVDDAIDLDHEDLAANIFVNWAEYNGTAGLDDDFNGYVDDINGWDFSENDNDPNPVIGSQDHGTHVAGCASAVTDNGIGVAAPGWKCKILPLKFSNDQNGALSGDAAAAIIYAADMGATVTNNSYGGGGYSNYFLMLFFMHMNWVLYLLLVLVIVMKMNSIIHLDIEMFLALLQLLQVIINRDFPLIICRWIYRHQGQVSYQLIQIMIMQLHREPLWLHL